MFLTKPKELQEYWDKNKALRKQLIEEIVNHSEEIDPGEERDWEDMIFGWATAKGLSLQDADNFASQVSYEIALAYPESIRLDAITYMGKRKL
jgi:hypothetical protein